MSSGSYVIQTSRSPPIISKERNGNGPVHYNNGSVSAEEPATFDLSGDMDLTVVLPSGQATDMIVPASVPMMDLLVQVAGKHKMNPTGHTLSIVSEETGKMIDYRPNQAIGALGVTTVYLLPKMSKKDRKQAVQASRAKRPFEVTHRLIVNLPRGQKTILRLNHSLSLKEIFITVCKDKHLDPENFELRHPVHPDEVLNLSRSLKEYGLNEINITNVSSSEHRLTTEDFVDEESRNPVQRSLSSASYTMAGRRAESEGYLPGAGKEKKKRGFFSFLKRDKSNSFKPNEVQHDFSSSTLTKPQAQVRPQPQRPHTVYITNPSTLPTEPVKPPRPTHKKRPAPPPPQQKVASLPDITSPTEPAHSPKAHSRNSSDSSGYHESPISATESPEAMREVKKGTKMSIDATSIESTEVRSDSLESPGLRSPNGHRGNYLELGSATLPLPRKQEHDQAAAGAVASATMPRKPLRKKKAPAPPPPTGAAKPIPASTAPPVVNGTSAAMVATATVVTVTTSPAAVVESGGAGEPLSPPSEPPIVQDPQTPHPNPSTEVPPNKQDSPVTSPTSPGSPERPTKPPRPGTLLEDGNDDSPKSRQAVFIPPPPPASPPPDGTPPPFPEYYKGETPLMQSVAVGRSVSESPTTEVAPPILHDGGSPPGDPPRSESRASKSSVDTIDTIADIEFHFDETIAAAQQALDREQEESSLDVSVFVEKMSQMTADVDKGLPEISDKRSSTSSSPAVIRRTENGTSETGSLLKPSETESDTSSIDGRVEFTTANESVLPVDAEPVILVKRTSLSDMTPSVSAYSHVVAVEILPEEKAEIKSEYVAPPIIEPVSYQAEHAQVSVNVDERFPVFSYHSDGLPAVSTNETRAGINSVDDVDSICSEEMVATIHRVKPSLVAPSSYSTDQSEPSSDAENQSPRGDVERVMVSYDGVNWVEEPVQKNEEPVKVVSEVHYTNERISQSEEVIRDDFSQDSDFEDAIVLPPPLKQKHVFALESAFVAPVEQKHIEPEETILPPPMKQKQVEEIVLPDVLKQSKNKRYDIFAVPQPYRPRQVESDEGFKAPLPLRLDSSEREEILNSVRGKETSSMHQSVHFPVSRTISDPQTNHVSVSRTASQPSIQRKPSEDVIIRPAASRRDDELIQSASSRRSKSLYIPSDGKIYDDFGSVRGTKGMVTQRKSQLDLVHPSEGEPEPEYLLEEKSISMMALPVSVSVPVELETADEVPSTPVAAYFNKKTMDPPQGDKKELSPLARMILKKDVEQETAEQPENAVIGNNKENEVKLQNQYDQLQEQFKKWQNQYEQNQSLLKKTKVISVPETPVVESSPRPVNVQKHLDLQHQVMSQLQRSIEQRRSPVTVVDTENEPPQRTGVQLGRVVDTPREPQRGVVHLGRMVEPSAETKARVAGQHGGRVVDAPKKFSEHAIPKAPPMARGGVIPAPPGPPPVAEKPLKSALKQSKTQQRRFEPELDPREALMIAIRNAGGRSTLSQVPKRKNQWYFEANRH